MSSQKIEIIGPFPPPYGGIAVHIERLIDYLKENNLDYIVHNHGNYENTEKNILAYKKSIFWYITYLFKKNSNIIHFHQTIYGFHYLYWYLYSRFRKNNMLITLHNENLLKQNKLLQTLNVWLLKKTNNMTLLVVSKKVNEWLKNSSIISKYMPAYVPLISSKTIKKQNDIYNIFCNVWKIVDHTYIKKYGFDLILDLIKYNNEKNIKLFVFVGASKNIDFLNKEIKQRKINEKVKVLINENLVEHFYYADLLIRANRDDAFGVSIQEAHDNGVPTLSSDVCERPKGTHLFKTDDFSDLLRLYNEIYKNDKKKLLNEVCKTKYHQDLINIYKHLME